MADPASKLSGALLPPENDQGQGKPVLHTLQADLEKLRKVTDPSLLERIVNESQKRQKSQIDFGALRTLPLKTYLWLGAGIVGILLLATGWYYLWPQLNATREKPQPVKLTPPPPLFASEASRTINVNSRDPQQFFQLMEDSYREQEREGTTKRILVKLQDGPQERFMNLADFFDFYRLTPTKSILDTSEKEIMPFFYYGEGGPRFGIAWRVKEYERAFAGMLSWEASLLANFDSLFFGEEHDLFLSSVFEDRVYRNIDWRFLKLSQEKDLGIAYTVFPAKKILVLTTSKSSMESVINRLFEMR